MSNIVQLAPYAYLAKRSGTSTSFDLFLLVPVGGSGDAGLSGVSPEKPPGSTRITIDYLTTTSPVAAGYRSKHWLIDTGGIYLDVQIRDTTDSSRSLIMAFANADAEPMSSSGDEQTCAPYIFARQETVGTEKFIHPSCIILLDTGLKVQSEMIALGTAYCKPAFVLGNGTGTNNPNLYLINQNIKAEITPNVPYTFEASLTDTSSLNKPPRKNKVIHIL